MVVREGEVSKIAECKHCGRQHFLRVMIKGEFACEDCGTSVSEKDVRDAVEFILECPVQFTIRSEVDIGDATRLAQDYADTFQFNVGMDDGSPPPAGSPNDVHFRFSEMKLTNETRNERVVF